MDMEVADRAHRPCVLLVDAATAPRSALASDFSACGYDAWCADDLEMAVTTAGIYPPDVVVTELTIENGGSATELMRRLRRIDVGAPTVVLTCRIDLEWLWTTLKAGANCCLAKPATATQILAALRARVAPPPPRRDLDARAGRAGVPGDGVVDLRLGRVDRQIVRHAAPLVAAEAGAVRPFSSGIGGVQRRGGCLFSIRLKERLSTPRRRAASARELDSCTMRLMYSQRARAGEQGTATAW